MSGPVIPELCLFCYENLTTKELKSRSAADLEQIQRTFTNDAIFILKVLLQVPEHLLEGFCVRVEDKMPPGLWISVCNRCSGAVEEAKLVYHQILELCAKFRDARGQMVEKVRESCGGGGGGGKRGRCLRKKGDNDFLKRIAITEECRKFVNERTFDPVTDEAFVVEDVAVWTNRFLAKLDFQKSVAVPQTVIIIPDYQEEEMGGEETLMTLDALAFNQNEDDLMAVDDKDPLSVPEDDNLSLEDKESFDIEVKEDVNEVKAESCPDSGSISSPEDDNDSEWKGDEDEEGDDDEAEVKTISKNLVLGGDKNECPTCHKEVRTESGLRMHLYNVHKVQFEKPDKSWSCPEPNCDSTFTDYKEYQHHVLCHKKGEPPDKCETCGKGFFGFKGLRYHAKLVHDIILQPKVTRRPGKPRICPTCGAAIKFPETFQDHMRTVHDKSDYTCVEPGRFPCTWENCDKVVTTLGSLRDHVRRHHQNLATVICEDCGAAFFTHRNRKRHRQSATPIDCKVCGETLASCDELTEHRKAYHPVKKEKRIDKRIKNPGSRSRSSAKSKEDKKKVARPRRSLDKKEAYQCYQCGKPFKTEKNLKDHLKFVHEGNYDLRCHLCGKGLRERLNLTIHLAREHNVTEDGSGQLPQCPVTGCRRVFPVHKQLEAHMTKFHGESGTEVRYQCGHCGKGFQSRYKFEQHEMTHTNAESRPVKCDICGKGFSNQHNMRYHQLNTHKVERKIKYERKRKKKADSEENV